MDPSNTFHKPRDNIPFSPNDYWDRSRFIDPNPTQSLASLPSHIQLPGSEEPESEPGLKPWPAAVAAASIPKPGTRPNSQNARLKVQDARGRTTDRSYAQQLKMRSRSPQFVPFERSVSGSRSVAASPRPSPRPSVDEKRPEVVRAGSDRSVVTRQWYKGQSEWGQRSESEPEKTEAEVQDQEKQTNQTQYQDQSTGKDPDEVVMSSTAYPGQEWTPAGLHGLEYF